MLAELAGPQLPLHLPPQTQPPSCCCCCSTSARTRHHEPARRQRSSLCPCHPFKSDSRSLQSSSPIGGGCSVLPAALRLASMTRMTATTSSTRRVDPWVHVDLTGAAIRHGEIVGRWQPQPAWLTFGGIKSSDKRLRTGMETGGVAKLHVTTFGSAALGRAAASAVYVAAPRHASQ